MDYSTDPRAGQQEVITLTSHLCQIMEMLRAWWAHFEHVIRELDRAASVKAYDLVIEGVTLARQIARQLEIALPDPSTIDWTVSPRPHREAIDL